MNEKHNPPPPPKKKKKERGKNGAKKEAGAGRGEENKPESWGLLWAMRTIVWNTPHGTLGLHGSGLRPVLMEENIFLKIKASRSDLGIC